ncbi:M42 family metallopeptidase [Pelagibacterium lacus]|uniref:M42 family peptidase n=1 Tax=Pelagibacterium lacus TaxID=2282655 RepID=A0A369W492_9HYPH|nr:M20/M25/M40 family metallo-hydrolase [Pelagibacterium lacus]RDE08827.1 M42 family peptidase [Pelagibacterium lacus]
MNIELLRQLCETPGVPGREHRVRKLIETEIAGLFDEVTTDSMGSLLCVRRSRTQADKPLKVMLLCHMDEIGFLVTHVSEKGWIHIDNVGGFDPRTLFARRVKVCTRDGDYPGVMNAGGRPLHISSPEDRKKVPPVKEFFVDIGLGAETRSKVHVGDFIVMDEPLVEMGDRIVSKALDNRMACWLGIETIRALERSGVDHACEIHVAFTTQEEVGCRGAKAASFAVRPDIGIGVDTTLACDTPGVPENETVTMLGKGVGLHIKDSSFIADLDLVDEFEAVAVREKIPFQRTILTAGGSDSSAAQQAAAGARAIGIAVGTRYIHTVAEMIDKTDLLAARDLLVAYLKDK